MLSWASPQGTFSSPHRKSVPSLPVPSPNVLPPPEVAFLDPILKTTWVVLSGGARAWEDNLVLLCNHALGWSPQPHQPPGDKAHALAQRPERHGRPRVGPSWKGDKSRGHGRPSGSHGAGNEMAPATRAVNKESQARCRSLVPGIWELGSQDWVFRVFCNYFPFVLP